MKRLTKVLYALTFLAVCAGALAFPPTIYPGGERLSLPHRETGAVADCQRGGDAL